MVIQSMLWTFLHCMVDHFRTECYRAQILTKFRVAKVKKYVKTETLTITKKEEVNLVDEKNPESQLIKRQLLKGLWQLLYKVLMFVLMDRR
jgi:hypothetical protein